MKKQSGKSKKALKPSTDNAPKLVDFFKKIEEKNSVRKNKLSEINHVKITDTIVINSDDSNDQMDDKIKDLNITKKRNNSDNESKTPKRKCNNPSPSKKNDLTPVKNLSNTPEKTKKTPQPKLFSRTPQKIKNFSVETIEKFVNITPSKSSVTLENKTTPTSSGKVQTSILKYISPSTSSSSKPLEAQKTNEMTPRKEVVGCSITPTSKVKTKLNFEAKKFSCSSVKSSNQSEDKENNEISNMLSENSLDEFIMSEFMGAEFEEECLSEDIVELRNMNLDLNKSKHCKVVKMEIFPSLLKLTVESTVTKECAVCLLKDFWLNMKLNIGDTIHLMAKKINQEWVIDNKNGLIVYEPDLLISSTSVVNALFCKRRNVLSDKFQGFQPSNESMIVGILVHSILQETLRKKLTTIDQIQDVLNTLLTSKQTIKKLYESDQSINQIRSKMSIYIPKIKEFIDSYVDVKLKNGRKRNINKDCWNGVIDDIEDIEENIWCPELGIKGKIDVSIKTHCNENMPLELKTGKATFSLEHRGQVLLYIMMMNKLGYKVPSGLLLYLKDGILKEVSMSDNEKRDIIIMRNELAYFLKRRPKTLTTPEGKTIVPSELPEPINHHSACGKCPFNIICTAFLKHDNYDFSSNQPLEKLTEDVLSHLDEQHLNYFINWSSLINLEQVCGNNSSKSVQEIYTMPPAERETKGKCISYLKISEISDLSNNLIDHTFIKADTNCTFNFFASGMDEGSYCVVSTDSRPSISSGLVTHIEAHSITIALDRNLRKKYHFEHFHVDTYESFVSQSFNQTSLTLLLEPSSRGAELRSIIIDKKEPTFQCKLPKIVANEGKQILRRLNKTQQRAILKALSANDFLLIKGMPGTGKTSTIVALVELLVKIGKTVLITSHTHSAVDNVCKKLMNLGIDFLRLGTASKISDKLKLYSESYKTKDCTTPEELNVVYNEAKVIASTCLGSGHPVLSKRLVDYCIVDESTQVLQTTLIRPLYASKTFILIGDPEQLPPVVRSQDAIEMGMAESLFDRLQSETSTISLTLNYRMNKKITDLANALTYKGELAVANDNVGNATLQYPKYEALKNFCGDSNWLLKILDANLDNSVKLINTGPVWHKNDQVAWNVNDSEDVKSTIFNIYEAAVISNITSALLEGGIEPQNIGVIAPFNCQVKQLSIILHKNIDVSTVDQFQGRDKDVVIYSCTKSMNLEGASKKSGFEILDDHRRLNVAVTRAKKKLIVIGDIVTIRRYTPFSKLISVFEESNIINLQDNVDGFCWPAVLNKVSK